MVFTVARRAGVRGSRVCPFTNAVLTLHQRCNHLVDVGPWLFARSNHFDPICLQKKDNHCGADNKRVNLTSQPYEEQSLKIPHCSVYKQHFFFYEFWSSKTRVRLTHERGLSTGPNLKNLEKPYLWL